MESVGEMETDLKAGPARRWEYMSVVVVASERLRALFWRGLPWAKLRVRA